MGKVSTKLRTVFRRNFGLWNKCFW